VIQKKLVNCFNFWLDFF